MHLSGVVAGRDLDQGVLDLDANVDGLTLGGTATLAGIPASVRANMDFRAGGPGQVLQRVSVTGRPTARQLAAVGLDASAVLDGPLSVDATLSERRDGGGDVAVTADLAPATVTIAALGWHKPPGAAMTASGRLLLSHDRLAGIEDIGERRWRGRAVASTASAASPRWSGSTGWCSAVTDARGTVRLPTAEAGPGDTAGATAISLSGPTLDLSARLAREPRTRPAPGKHEPPSGPHWTLDASFDRVIMAGDHQVTGLAARLDSDGGLTRRLEMDGLTGPKAPFSMRIVSAPPSRQAHATNGACETRSCTGQAHADRNRRECRGPARGA